MASSIKIFNKSLLKTPGSITFQKLRYLHSSCVFHNKSFYEDNPKGNYHLRSDWFKLEQERRTKMVKNLWGLRDGFKDLRTEISLWKDETYKQFTEQVDSQIFIEDGDRDIPWKFDSEESLKKWKTVSDYEHNEGFSRCELISSPTGKGLFHGYINSEPPKDGRVKYAGYCNMTSVRPMLSFKRESYHDFSMYSCLVMRIRGDGRNYMINLCTPGYYDITWHDVYSYILYTHGGPYWQYVKIPFSKFVFASKGRLQDRQCALSRDRIATVGLSAGRVDGPFALEIDYIGVEADFAREREEFAYESYNVGKFIADT